MNRRQFSALLPFLAATPAFNASLQAQTAPAVLPSLKSGAYPPGPANGPTALGRTGRRFTLGMLPSNIRLESHTTTLLPGAGPEALDHHKHSELWFVREGAVTLMTAGETRTLKAGEMGLCVAGDDHYVSNASKTEPASYFVVAVGPPE